MTACDFLIGLALYVGASAIAWLWVQVTRPATCPKGHRDLHHLLRRRCRECKRVAQVRRLRRLLAAATCPARARAGHPDVLARAFTRGRIVAKKKCSDCGRSRSLDNFPEDPRHADGRGSYCRECAAERTRAWREKHRKAHREYHREYMRRRRKGAA